MYIYIEEMRRVGGRGDIRKPDWWYDECGEGMRRQNEPLPATTTCQADFLPRQGLSREVCSALEKKKATVADHCAHVAVRNAATQNTEETG